MTIKMNIDKNSNQGRDRRRMKNAGNGKSPINIGLLILGAIFFLAAIFLANPHC